MSTNYVRSKCREQGSKEQVSVLTFSTFSLWSPIPLSVSLKSKE